MVVALGLKTLPAAHPACIIALTYLELAAYAMGLGPCWAGYFMRASQSFSPLIRGIDLPKDHQVFGGHDDRLCETSLPPHPLERCTQNHVAIGWKWITDKLV